MPAVCACIHTAQEPMGRQKRQPCARCHHSYTPGCTLSPQVALWTEMPFGRRFPGKTHQQIQAWVEPWGKLCFHGKFIGHSCPNVYSSKPVATPSPTGLSAVLSQGALLGWPPFWISAALSRLLKAWALVSLDALLALTALNPRDGG